jgi:hypothetical protein
MKKQVLLGILILSALVLVGCESIDLSQVSDEDIERISEKAVVCNDPYIRFGTSCCLDKDSNKICNQDENSKEESVSNQKTVVKSPPEIEDSKGSDAGITQNVKSAEIDINKVQIQLANLYPSRVTVTNTGDVTIKPKFDLSVVDSGGNEVCSGSPIISPFNNIPSGQKKTEELTIMGCMFTEDGSYILTIDLLDKDYNKLDSNSKGFDVNYWSKFNFG